MSRENTRDARNRFVDLAQKRVRRVIKDIRLVGNLSNTTNYKYSPEDAKKIVRVLTDEIKKLDDRFKSTDGADDITFKL